MRHLVCDTELLPTTSKKRPETTYNEQETAWNNLQRPETGNNDVQLPRNDLQRPTMSNKRPETTYNDLQRATNDLQRPGTSKKRPETTYNEQETAWNNLQRTETTNNDLQQARNDLKRPTTSKTQSTMTWTYLQRAKERRETTNNKHIFRLFYNMGQTVLFSNTFSTQHLVAVIRVLLHGESWWKQSVKHLYIIMCIFYGFQRLHLSDRFYDERGLRKRIQEPYYILLLSKSL